MILATVIAQGLLADRPNAGVAGRLYAATDDGSVYRDNGASWDIFSGTGNLANPMTTEGDIITGGASGAALRLAVGAEGQALVVGGATPIWGTPALAVSDLSDVDLTPPPINGQVLVWNEANNTWAAGAGAGGSGGGTAPTDLAQYEASSGTIPPDTVTRINFDNEVIDPNNHVTTGAGVWSYLVPHDGYYQVGALLTLQLLSSNTAGDTIEMMAEVEIAGGGATRNSVLDVDGSAHTVGSVIGVQGATTLYLLAGESVRITLLHTANSDISLIPQPELNRVAIVPIVAPLRTGQAVLSYGGLLTPSTRNLRLYNQLGRDVTITKVFAAVNTAPQGDSIVIDILEDGTSLWPTTPGSRPTIADGATTTTQEAIESPIWEAESYLQLQIVQVGSTTEGADLSVHVVYTY